MTPAIDTFIAANLPKLCTECIAWRKSGWLHGGAIKQLQGMMPLPANSPDVLPFIATMIERAAMLAVIAQEINPPAAPAEASPPAVKKKPRPDEPPLTPSKPTPQAHEL